MLEMTISTWNENQFRDTGRSGQHLTPASINSTELRDPGPMNVTVWYH